jgi:rhodanese-related sulfurtransferase
MTDRDRREDERDLGRVARGMALIVVVGAALGVAYNAFGLASRPPRGLAWVKRVEPLASLESMLRPVVVRHDSATAAAPDGASPADGATPAVSASATPAEPPTGRPAAPAAATPAPPAGAVTPAPPPAAAGTPAGTAGLPAIPDLPVVPESDRPVAIGLAMFKRFHDAGGALVVDAREAPEYATGHVPGAVHLSYNDALGEPERIGRLGEGPRPIVVYCSSVSCDLARDLAKFLIENGKRRVLVYEGGFAEWSAAGHAVEKGGAR